MQCAFTQDRQLGEDSDNLLWDFLPAYSKRLNQAAMPSIECGESDAIEHNLD